MKNWETEIFKNLNDSQQHAVKNTQGPVLILAGAGSGKTRTIIHRLAYLIHVQGVSPHHILMVTFTNKAAEEMRERANALAGPIASSTTIRTYHSLGLSLLRQYSDEIGYPSTFSIWDDSDQQRVFKSIVINKLTLNLKKNEIRYLMNVINGFKNKAISVENIDDIDFENYSMGDVIPTVYREYEKIKQSSFALDFGDLILQMVQILQKNESIREILQQRYLYIMVDEYQDTNHVQYLLSLLLAQKNKNICVVGDDDQAIYGWRGADVSNILNFNRDFPNAYVVKLEENYRSTTAILNVANEVIAHNENRLPKTLWSQKETNEKPKLVSWPNDRSEANFIAQSILKSKPEKLSEVGVLYRTNAQSRLIEEAFLRFEIPYKVYGGISFFERKEIKDTLAYLKFLVNPFDEVSFLRIVNFPSRGVGSKSLEKIMDYHEKNPGMNFLLVLQKVQEIDLPKKAQNNLLNLFDWIHNLSQKVLRQIDLSLLFTEVLNESQLRREFEEEDRLLQSNRMENIEELKNSIIFFQQNNPQSGLNEYLQEISLYTSRTVETEPVDAVCLMTVHNAKGLEFDTVFLCGLEEDTFPHYLSKSGDLDEMEEERRLFYVGVTRAKNQLYLSRANTRQLHTHMGYGYAAPSRFLNEFDAKLIESVSTYENEPRKGGYGYEKPVKQTLNQFFKDGYSKSSPVKNEKKWNQSTSQNIKSNISMDDKNIKESFQENDRVIHKQFGEGRVVRLEGNAEAKKIHIAFNDGRTRKFILRFTKLEKLKN